MSTADIRAAIAARAGSVEGIGHVHAWQRYAVRQTDFKNFYQHEGRLLGWFIHRVSAGEYADSGDYRKRVHRWRIEGVMSLDDAAASEIIFDNLIEALCAAFRADDTLGGVVDGTTVDGQIGLQLEENGPSMFAGVLCHHARLSLATISDAPVGIAVGHDGLDDFRTGGITWDRALPDQRPEAEDLITLETAA